MTKHRIPRLGALLVGAALTAALPAAGAKSIYHRGWIDLNKNGVKDVYEDPARPVAERVADLVARMTVEEKTCQLATLYGYGRVLQDSLPVEGWKDEVWRDGIANIDEMLNGVGGRSRRVEQMLYPFSRHAEAINRVQRWFVEQTRLGIPVDFSNEGIHGLNHTRATPLPAPIGVGSTWNRDLVRQAGTIVGREARALGYTNVYAPILDLARDPRWGRTLECYGEDPYLVAELGTEMARGIQSQGVASTLKHYAVYSVPKGGRDGDCRTDPHVAPRELHQLYLYPFRRVVREARPMGVMSSYNDWDGVPVTASHYFLTELLRGAYGFDGYVVSDSYAVEYVQRKHRVAETYDDAVRQVLEAGLNVRTDFSSPAEFILAARRLVSEGKLSMQTLDRRVAEVLAVKFRLGLFDHPYVADPEASDTVGGVERNLDFVRRVQAQSLVLLKNEGGLLPLCRDSVRRVLVAGPLADEDNFMESRYGPNRLDRVTVLQGLRDYLAGRAEVRYAKGCDVVNAGWPDSELLPPALTAGERQSIDEAARMGRDCDVIIAVLGEDDERTGESRSRTSLDPARPPATTARSPRRHGAARRARAHQRPAPDRQLGRPPRAGHPRGVVPHLPGRARHRRDPLRRAQPRRQAPRHLPQVGGPGRTQLPLQARRPRRTAPGRTQRLGLDARHGRPLPLRLRTELHHLPLLEPQRHAPQSVHPGRIHRQSRRDQHGTARRRRGRAALRHRPRQQRHDLRVAAARIRARQPRARADAPRQPSA